MGHSNAYYPQRNALAESSNKSLIRIIKNMVSQDKKSWYFHLKYALWDDRISEKRVLGTSPF